MKEATGEMTTTIIVIIGLVAVLGLATTFLWPTIKNGITRRVNDINGESYDDPFGTGGGAGGDEDDGLGGYIINDYYKVI